MNGVSGHEIVCRRRLRQEDPLSLLLFVLVADGFNKIIRKAEKLKLVEGLRGAPHATYINLQYADDTLLFGTDNIKNAIVIKWLLCCFEAWLGLRINFYKDFLILLGKEIVAIKIIK